MTNTRVFWIWVTSILLAFAGCSGDSPRTSSEQLASVAQALSSSQERVLQFEAPTTDWTTTAGSLSASSVIAQGSAALAVDRPTSSWTEVCSTQLSSLGSVGNTLTLQLLQQSTPSWGSVQLFVRIPSLGHWNTAVQPPITLHDKAPNVFHSLAFPLGNTISQALGGTYADLRLCFVINASAGVHVLDDLRFSGLTTAAASTGSTTASSGTVSSAVGGSAGFGGVGGSVGGTGGGGGTSGGTGGDGGTTGGGGSGETSSTTGTGAEGGSGGTGGAGGTAGEPGEPSQCVPQTEGWDRLIVRVPRGLALDDVALGSQGGELDIHDGVAVRTGDGQGFANIAALEGTSETQLGAYAESGHIFSGVPIELRSHATVRGFAKSGGAISEQSGAHVEQAKIEGFDHQPYEEFAIPYRFPEAYNSQPSVITNGATYDLAPGAYGNLSVQAQSTLRLSPGDYYFESLNLEPGTHFVLNNSAGGISLFIRNSFQLKVEPSYSAPSKFNVLYAVVGSGPVTLERNFRGTLIAPDTNVALPTANISVGHHGTIFARGIVVHQHTDFYHHPYQRDPADCSTLDPEGLGGFPGCPAKDTDGDGLSNCFEENDGSSWTDPEQYNGTRVALSDLCHSPQGLLVEDFDTREEIEDCLANATNTETGTSTECFVADSWWRNPLLHRLWPRRGLGRLP